MVILIRCHAFYWGKQHWNNSFCSLVPILVDVVIIFYILQLPSLYFHHTSDVVHIRYLFFFFLLYLKSKSVSNMTCNLQLVFMPLGPLVCYSGTAFSRPLLSSGACTLNPSTEYHCFKWMGLISSLF